MTKFVNDDWLLEGNLISQEEYDAKYINKEGVQLFGGEEKVESVQMKSVHPLELTCTVESCLKAFEQYDIDYVNFFLNL